jgi:hypothetical protein
MTIASHATVARDDSGPAMTTTNARCSTTRSSRPIRWKIRHDKMPATGPGDIAAGDIVERGGARRGMRRRPAKFERATGRAGTQGSHERALHINAIVRPIPTKVYKPATVTPRQTSAMTLSGWSLICLPCTALLLGYCPTQIDHAGGGQLFRFQGRKAYRRRNGNFTKSRPRSTSGARDGGSPP